MLPNQIYADRFHAQYIESFSNKGSKIIKKKKKKKNKKKKENKDSYTNVKRKLIFCNYYWI